MKTNKELTPEEMLEREKIVFIDKSNLENEEPEHEIVRHAVYVLNLISIHNTEPF